MPNQDSTPSPPCACMELTFRNRGSSVSVTCWGDPENGSQKGWVDSWVLLSDQLYPNMNEDWQLSCCVKWNGSCHQASKAPGSQKGLGLDLSKNRSKGDSG